MCFVCVLCFVCFVCVLCFVCFVCFVCVVCVVCVVSVVSVVSVVCVVCVVCCVCCGWEDIWNTFVLCLRGIVDTIQITVCTHNFSWTIFHEVAICFLQKKERKGSGGVTRFLSDPRHVAGSREADSTRC